MNQIKERWALTAGLLCGLLAGLSASGQAAGGANVGAAVSTQAPAKPVSASKRVSLPDGRILTLEASGDALTLRGDDRRSESRSWRLAETRIGASLTVLPSGRVLLWGGSDPQRKPVAGGYWFDPALDYVQPALDVPVSIRGAHTATVLIDGRVLFAGEGASGPRYELWREGETSAEAVPASSGYGRVGHGAELQADGRVRLFGGRGAAGPVRRDAWFDPLARDFTQRGGSADLKPGLAASLPAQGASGVMPDARLAVRFGTRVRAADLDAAHATLWGPGGAALMDIVVAEQGRLAFFRPKHELFPGSRYTLLIDRVRDVRGNALPAIAIDFSTAVLAARSGPGGTQASFDELSTGDGSRAGCAATEGRRLPCRRAATLDAGVWTPGRDSTEGRWRVRGRVDEPESAIIMQRVTEAMGLTTVIGRIAQVDGSPVADVEVSIGNAVARTDAAGRFTVYNAPAGKRELYVDGTTANSPGVEYGQFVVGVQVDAGRLTQVPYTMYLPRISARDKVSIASPLARDVVLTHPDMPGLQVHIPAGTVVRDRKGRLVREMAIVPTPVNRAPFPVAANYPMYFTLEPGGASIQGLTPEAAQGVRVFYPNYDGLAAGTQADFWIYDPADGWRVYGQGRVTSDGSRFAPEAGVALHRTMGGSYSVSTNDPASEPDKPPCNDGCGAVGTGGGASAGDPIDLRTGEFVYAETDVQIQDLMPLQVSRNYRPNDLKKREFGIGTAANFNFRLMAPGGNYDALQVILPGGTPIPFQRVSGSGAMGKWQAASSPTMFNHAVLELQYGVGYFLSFRDGSEMVFGKYAPNPLQWITDRYGNKTEFVYDAGLVSKIVSPSGRELLIDYDADNRIEQVSDATGRSWTYAYANGLLASVTYPDQTSRQYGYKTKFQMSTLLQHRVETITDQRGNRLLLNEFEDLGLGGWSGRVVKQTLADGAVYAIDYAHIDGGTTGVLVTSPDGSKRRLVYNGGFYPVSDTVGYGTPQAQTYRFERTAAGLMSARIDPAGRRTEYDYDTEGRLLRLTRSAGTAQENGISLTYNAQGDPETVEDELGREVSIGYSGGCLSTISDPLDNSSTFACNGAGQLTATTDSLGNTTTLEYNGADLEGVVDPLGRRTTFANDALGRMIAMEDPSGNRIRREYDTLGRVTRSVDGSGRATEFGYDANGNLEAVLLPNGNGITYVYDDRDRLLSRTDSLGQIETWTYDPMGRIETYTDRKGQETGFEYDPIGRPVLTTYDDGSTVSVAYDDANRIVGMTDSVSGSMSWEYDGAGRVLAAHSPQGSVAYTYDTAGRRVSRTAGSQAAVEFQYDTADRLTRVLQGSEAVEFEYDDANRLIETVLPNDVRSGYAYNAAGQLTGIAWLKPDGSPLGDLGYAYNPQGRLTTQTGSFASSILPVATAGTNTFDDNQRQTSHQGVALTYDANGDLIGDGTRTYVWNARGQLAQIKQGANTLASFAYDAMGRRYAKTEAGVTTQYLYDGLDVVEESRNGTARPVLTGLGMDERYARTDGAGRTYFLTDMLGSTRALTDASGAVVQRYDYTSYGDTAQTAPGFDNPYRYTGREQDASGLYYYRARYYSPGLGRFISEDQIGLAGGFNPYAYVGGNPVGYRDPSGNCPICVVGIVWGLIEIGLAIYDIYDTGKTLLDPCASAGQKAASVGLLAAGMLLPGGGYSAADDAVDGLADLAKFRDELGLAPGDGTLARLDVNGESFYGINAHGQPITMNVNAITRTHAEADAFQQALNAGQSGGDATLYVDRALCPACGQNGGVRGMARQAGLNQVTVITPQGTQVIRP